MVLHGGYGYIFTDKEQAMAHPAFEALVKSGQNGLCITRTHPNKTKCNSFNIRDKVEIVWITDVGSGDYVLPPKPEYIVRKVEKFIENHKNEKCVILLDGIEYLITHISDSYKSILTLVHILSDHAAQSNAIIIIPIDSGAISNERLKLLSRDLKFYSG